MKRKIKAKKNYKLMLRISESGRCPEDLAKELGVSQSSVYNKLKYATDWKVREIKCLAKMLHLTNDEIVSYFLS